ncbi:MAG TPA: glycosyltransferase family 87 protein [Trebonia sp.]|nr:glycosyltransferase family 87 protein [Trebonia sp.]
MSRKTAMSGKFASACRWSVLLGCLIMLGGLIGLLSRPSLYDQHFVRMDLVAAAFVVFGVAAAVVRKVAVKAAIWLIIISGIAIQAVGFTAPPAHSSDIYRYMWDGQVQAAGVDPYLYAPSDAALVSLRNDYLWGPWTATPPRGTGLQYCVTNDHSKRGPAFDTVVGCSRINRTNAPTIYPPVTEAWFTAVYLVAGDSSSMPMQVAMSLCAVLTTLVLLWGLRKMGGDPRLVALWAWCPTATLEVGNDGHSDVLGTLLCAIALIVLATARTRRKTLLGGVLFGLALATKLTPAFLMPSTLKRGWGSILGAAGTVTFLVYLPHVLAVGRHIVGFFPTYLQEQGYSSGTGYEILALLVRGKLASVVAFALLGLVALAVLRYSHPDQPWRGAIYMMAAALVIGTPQFEWYSMLLVMLVVLDGRWEWLALPAGAYLSNDPFITSTTLIDYNRQVGYAGGLVVALVITGLRYLHARRDRGTGTRTGTEIRPAEALPLEALPAETMLPETMPVPSPVTTAS